MPMYDYTCVACGEKWEEMKSMANRDEPCKNPCPHCGEKSVKKTIEAFPTMGTDATLTADKATGGQWGELMNRMKDKVPDRMKHRLDGHGVMNDQVRGRRWK